MKTIFSLSLALALGVLLNFSQAFAQQTTAFTYQGQLRDGGTNANGTYTMIFKLFDAVTNGNQISSAITNTPTLANGLFTVNLDFGAAAFNGSARWLDITITNGGVTQILSPRVQVMPTPYALYATTAGNLNTNGSVVAGTITATNLVLSVGGKSWTFGVDTNGNLTLSDGLFAEFLESFGLHLLKNMLVDGHADIKGALNAAIMHVTGDDGLGDWTISEGTVSPPGMGTINNALVFSTSGTPRLAIDPNGNGAWLNSSSSGGLITSGMHATANVTIDGNLSHVTSINASGDVTAGGNMYAQNFNTSSDRNLKENFAPINAMEILERVASLPISRWKFKTDADTRHIGPMAQDFYSAFNVGLDDKHIATVDEGGVALAAIQGLNEKLKEKDARIESLEKRLADLEELVKSSTHK